MGTKFTKLSDLLGQEKKPKGKPIEFTQFFDTDGIEKPRAKPSKYKEVIYLGEDSDGDVFKAIGDNGVCSFYRGHLNDGFIEE